MKNRKSILKSVHFFIAGGLLVTTGVDKLSTHHPIGVVITGAGVLLILFFVHGLVFKKPLFLAQILGMGFEVLTLVFTAIVFHLEGREYLQYVTFLSAIILTIAIGLSIYKRNRKIS